MAGIRVATPGEVVERVLGAAGVEPGELQRFRTSLEYQRALNIAAELDDAHRIRVAFCDWRRVGDALRARGARP